MTALKNDSMAQGRGGLRYASTVARISGEGAQAWRAHFLAEQMAQQGRDVIFLSIGDPDFDTPRPIVDAAVEALRSGRTHYTGFAGTPELRAAIAQRHGDLFGQEIDPAQIVVVSGGQAGLYITMMCLAEFGDEVIVPEPMYATYEAVVRSTGADLVRLPLARDKGFHLDIDALRAAITPKTKVVLVNFPHNPTGAMLSAQEAEGLAEICIEHDLWLVSDEVYATLTYSDQFRSPATLDGMAERTCVISSLSKSHAMPGWRLGWVLAPGDLPKHLRNAVQCVLFGSPPFVQDAAVVAVSRDYDELVAMREEFRIRRDLIVARFEAMARVRCVAPEGGMFAFIDVRESGLDSNTFALRLVEAEAVSTLPGGGFGPSGEGYLRLSLTAPREQIVEGLDRIERFVTGLNR